MININILRAIFVAALVIAEILPAKTQTPANLRSTLSIGGPSISAVSESNKNSVAQSIGQSSVINSYHSEGYMLRQGFIQPILSSKSNSDQNLQGNIFPNPFTNEITIIFSEEITEALSVHLYDVLGSSVYLHNFPSAQELNVVFPSIKPGVYFIRIISGNKQLTTKLIKE
jgi:Secretion system C-terminal sorting domain